MRPRRCWPGRRGRSGRPFRMFRPGWGRSGGRPSRLAGSAMHNGGRRRGSHLGRRRRWRPHMRRPGWGPYFRARSTPGWPRWRWRRCAELKYQPSAVLRIAEGDRPAVMDENRGHSHAVDVDAAFAAIDGYPLPAVVMQHHAGRRGGGARAVDTDIRPAVGADGHVPADGEGVFLGPEPDDQSGSECFRRHSRPLPLPRPPILGRVTVLYPPSCNENRRRHVGAGQARPRPALTEMRPVAGPARHPRGLGAERPRHPPTSGGPRTQVWQVAVRSPQPGRLARG